jgi:uncharacterized protein
MIWGDKIADDRGLMEAFEWDENKAQDNLIKHGISFEEASTVFEDLNGITLEDTEHSFQEVRYIEIGQSDRNRLLLVSYTERGTRFRIISARPCTPREARLYDPS